MWMRIKWFLILLPVLFMTFCYDYQAAWDKWKELNPADYPVLGPDAREPASDEETEVKELTR